MVLQRDIPIKIFGTGYEKIKFLNEYVEESSEKDKWCVTIFLQPAGGPYNMEIELNGEFIIIKDILIGDVYIAGGQSNMEMPVFNNYSIWCKRIAVVSG